MLAAAAAAAKSLQSCPTLCNPIDGSPPGSPVPGILQARILEWDAISFSNAWKWKVKVKSLSRVWLLETPWTAAYQAPLSWDFPGKRTGVGCHCLLRNNINSNREIKPCCQKKWPEIVLIAPVLWKLYGMKMALHTTRSYTLNCYGYIKKVAWYSKSEMSESSVIQSRSPRC